MKFEPGDHVVIDGCEPRMRAVVRRVDGHWVMVEIEGRSGEFTYPSSAFVTRTE